MAELRLDGGDSLKLHIECSFDVAAHVFEGGDPIRETILFAARSIGRSVSGGLVRTLAPMCHHDGECTREFDTVRERQWPK
jgi:hypothetical protein